MRSRQSCRQNARRIGGRDFPTGASGHVKVIESDRYRRDNPQMWGGGEQLFVGFFGEQADQGVFITYALKEFCSRNMMVGRPIIRVETFIENSARSFE